MSSASTPVSITPVRDVPARAAAWCAVVRASLAADLPDEPLPSRQRLLARLAEPGAGSRMLTWLAATPDGEVTAVASARLNDQQGRENSADAELHVHPEHRRQGIGTALLDEVAGAVAAAGRDSLVVTVPEQSPGDVFCLRRGLSRELVLHHLLLPLSDVHRAWLDELVTSPRPGYHLTGWDGPVPETLAKSFAAAKDAMNDMPAGESSAPAPRIAWTAESLRAMADAVTARGDRLLTVAAVHGATEEVAGYTELAVPGDGARRAQQYDTAVVPAHRGHGLGVWVKAEMLRRVHDEHPGVAEIETDNAGANDHMLAVNEQLGFRPYRRSYVYQLALTRP
ncbi:GNAT family N-acetyltransferase [Streptomyces sp. A7024]|uniref:GNAT family N-acetyltransferase n=1 Tax=Streptomyces coryli TaxID=1128680 RepID=A0A6G4U792_9ACTN|nr:GNAT family N-acetyltransferase [Streptomyces coryli]NGN67600.1 GNAT family N-acetyltransferase [Streptomyces coryli]